MNLANQENMKWQEKNHSERVAVLIPVYRGSTLIRDALSTLKNQTYKNLKIYISDDTPENERNEIALTKRIIDEFNEFDISYKLNPNNLGYPLNLISLVEWASEDLLFLLAQDDILSEIAIESCVKAMDDFPEIGAVARPYYWYFDNLNTPVRRIKELHGQKPHLITTDSDIKNIIHVLISASQLTGLMYRKSKLNVEFRNSIFPAHIYPLAGALRDHGIVFLTR
jgi:GT2 family glycosyltransferase